MASSGSLGQRTRRFAAVGAALVLVSACGASNASPGAPVGSGGPATSAQVGNLPALGLKNVTTQTVNARGATVGREGGTITATADDGTTYSLALPAGALAKPTAISLYPVSSVAGLPDGSKLSAGVQFAPDGLALDVPATLTITPKAAPDPKVDHGLSWQGDAIDLHAYPAILSGATATIRIDHFSGAGIGNPPLVQIPRCSTQIDMETAVGSAIALAFTDPASARDLLKADLKDCYANFVKPSLIVGGTLVGPDDIVDAEATRVAYDWWYSTVIIWGPGISPGFTVSPELAESKPLAAKFLRNWFDTTNAKCVAAAGDGATAVIDASAAIGLPHRNAPAWAIDTRANKLDYETLLTDLCVKVVINPSRTFSGSKPGDAGSVTVPVDYSVNGHAGFNDLPIHVTLTETGASSPFADDDAPSDGHFAAPYTWPATVNPLKIDVLASLADYPDIAVFDRITKHPGSKIALVIRDATNQTGIVVIDEDGTHLRAVTTGPYDSWPSWSPDGTQIAFARQTTGSGTSNLSIQVVNADGTGLKALTSGPFDSGPAWAPDGSRIAFVRSSATGQSLMLMNPDGTNVVDTGVKVFGAKLSWSPDSTQIVYSNYDDDLSGVVRLWVWPAAGGSSTKLVTHACEPWGATAPEWSSTGIIGFYCDVHGNPDGNAWIASMSATGAGYKAMTGNLYGKVIGGPAWSPDGTKYALIETGKVVVHATGGGSSTNLSVAAGGTIVGLEWGP